MINLKNLQKRLVHQCRTLFELLSEHIKVKPLTEEEKKQKLAELREKMNQKRAAKAIADTAENKENEKIRRRAGKVRALTASLVMHSC